MIRPDRLKTYLSALEEHGRESVRLAGSWLVSTLTWFPLLIGGVWISSNRQGVMEAMVKSVVRSMGSSLGRKIARGILGSLMK